MELSGQEREEHKLKKIIKKVLNYCSLEIKIDKVRIIKAAVFAILFFTAMFMNPKFFFEPLETGEIQVHPFRIPRYIFLILGGASLFLMEFKTSQFFRRLISIEAALAFPFLLTYLSEWINTGDLLGPTARPSRWMANILCCWLIYAIFLVIIRRIHIAAIFTALAVWGFGVANYYIIIFRGTPILPWDFQSLGTAMAVSEGYEFALTNQILQSIMLLVISLRLIRMIKPDYKTGSFKSKIIERAMPAFAALILFIAIIPFDALKSLDINIYAWNQVRSNQITGVTAGFFGNLQFLMVEKPEGYSAEKIEELKAKIKGMEDPKPLGNPGKKPTIIAVMNESFADMQKAAGDRLQFSEDNIPFVRELMASDKTISGEAYASVIGGGTCDSEYEFLTGNPTLFLPTGSKPYQQYVNTNQTTLVSALISQGYEAVAIHPGEEEAWHRNKVYPLFGFEKFVYRDIFDVEKENVRHYTTDRSCYKQIIFEYENRKNNEEPLFIFNVTIQNHGGFEEQDYEHRILVDEHESGMVYSAAEQYMTLVKDSDEDLQVLIDYFEKEEEPVVIIFYGDHWPKLWNNYMSKLLGVADMTNRTVEEIMLSQVVPYFIWANYPLEQNADLQEKVSFNQLAPLLMRAAGLELTPYQKYLTNISKSLPVITAVGLIDAKGQHYQPDKETPYTEIMQEYSILMHNNVFDEEHKVYELFEPAAQNG